MSLHWWLYVACYYPTTPTDYPSTTRGMSVCHTVAVNIDLCGYLWFLSTGNWKYSTVQLLIHNQPSVHVHTAVWTQTDCTVTQTFLHKRKLWEVHPWEVYRPKILYGRGKTGNLITTFAYSCVQCAVSCYGLVMGYMVLYTDTVIM